MKKIFLMLTFMVLSISAGSMFAQFQGTLEIKETTYKQSLSSTDKATLEFYTEQIKYLEKQLSDIKKTDNKYKEKQNEIDELKQILAEFDLSKPKTEYSKMAFLGSNVRVEEYSEGQTSTDVSIVMTKEEKIVVLMPEEKKYMELTLQTVMDIAKAFQGAANAYNNKTKGSDESKIAAKKTSKSTTLHGYKCEEYVYSNETSISTAWICENFTDFWKIFKEITAALDTEGSNTSNDRFIKAMIEKGFPFKVIEKDKTGKLLSEFEVTKVDKKKPDSNLFEIPKGYVKLDLKSMLGE